VLTVNVIGQRWGMAAVAVAACATLLTASSAIAAFVAYLDLAIGVRDVLPAVIGGDRPIAEYDRLHLSLVGESISATLASIVLLVAAFVLQCVVSGWLAFLLFSRYRRGTAVNASH